MRLVSRLEKDGVSRLILDTLAMSVRKIEPFYDTLEISFGGKNSVRITDSAVFISLDKSNDFLMERDEKAIKALVLKLVALAGTRRLAINVPFLEEILSDRELIKDGFGDELFYYYYLSLANAEKSAGFEKFLEISIPWLSFAGLDDSYSSFLFNLSKIFNYRKEFESVTKDFFEKVRKMKKTDVQAVAKAYVSLVSKYNSSIEAS
ncbi:MAG: hypothetical protein HYT72_00760 [Candidatus Aenigmarchaeota archaeon]|nr:hypothetical protein [Candidatus Aenigmarchaeota archaeon]